MNRESDHFFYSSTFIKNPLDKNVNKNVTLSSAHRSNIETDKSANDLNIQSSNSFTTPADIFIQDNATKVTQTPKICIDDNVILSSPNL